jgi:hypothetical protein
MGHKPYTFAQQDIATFIAQLKACLASKGTVYYNKIQGAVKCSNNDLSKLELIIFLISQYDNIPTEPSTVNKYSLDCIFTGQPFPGFKYESWDWQFEGLDEGGGSIITDLPISGDNTYLQDFLDFAEKFCRECIVTTGPAPAPTPEGDIYLKGENNAFILLEDNTTKITL